MNIIIHHDLRILIEVNEESHSIDFNGTQESFSKSCKQYFQPQNVQLHHFFHSLNYTATLWLWTKTYSKNWKK